MKLSLVAALCALIAACGSRPRPTGFECDESVLRDACDGDDFACAAIDALDETISDDALRRLWPALGDKVITDTAPVPITTTFRMRGFADVDVTPPIDWSIDPHQNRSWRYRFQSLLWLDGEETDVAAAVLVDWTRQALSPGAALEWTYYDHSLALRLERAMALLERYIAESPALSRVVLESGARLIRHHANALATRACYTELANHGVAQDIALLKLARRLPMIERADELRAIAESRLIAQADGRVSADGIHGENSPGYQIYFIELLTAAVATMNAGAAREHITGHRNRLVAALPHLLQPNGTFPQFGDTENLAPRVALRRLAETVAMEQSTEGVLATLETLTGERDAWPSDLDRVFAEGGYAGFRTDWSAGATTGHMTCNMASEVHYQPDEGSFEIAAHGTELIVDTGLYGYDRGPFVAYQRHARGQNVLVVDGTSYQASSLPRLIGSTDDPRQPWAVCAHRQYQRRGIGQQRRSFAFAKPDAFAIVDHVGIDVGARPRLTQMIHLHPSLDRADIRERAVIARGAPEGPSLVIVSLTPPLAIEAMRGRDDDLTVGWWFPQFNTAEAATELAFHHGPPTGAMDLPLLVRVVAPGEDPETVAAALASARFTTDAARWRIDWTEGGLSRQIEVPR